MIYIIYIKFSGKMGNTKKCLEPQRFLVEKLVESGGKFNLIYSLRR